MAQDCNEPAPLCPQIGSDTTNTTDGAPVSISPDFCFDEAPNAVFFEFSTLDTDQYTFIDYLDSTATVTLSIDSCNSDTLFGQGLNFVIFTAEDLCDATSYQEPVFCTTEVMSSSSASLTGLLPSSTYYIMVTGLFGPSPAENASECTFNVDVQGPAVTYNLEPDPTNIQIINPGESATMNVNPNFGPYSWTGEALNSTTGPTVTASPTEFNLYTYDVDAEIEGCPYRASFIVNLQPPISPFNAFTPNGDGFNDNWEIDRIERFPNAQIVVYSRWGTKVWQATNYRNNWDGDDLPAATYYYVVELNDPDNFDAPPITGSVTILR